MRSGTYDEIMDRITRSKQAELRESAKLSFSQKLAMSAVANRSADQLILSESFAEPVLEVIKLFNLAVKAALFDKYALVGGLAVEYYGAPINRWMPPFWSSFLKARAACWMPRLFLIFLADKAVAWLVNIWFCTD